MNFNDYALSDEITKALQLLHYEKPTDIQELVLPHALTNEDLWVKAQTGSGKTAAFGIPLCERCDWLLSKPQALVLVPTRELAIQVAQEISDIGRFKRLKVLPVFGRMSIERQELELKQKTHIVVATPGRLRDLMERGTFLTDELRYVVIDEADEMFFIGLRQQVEDILRKLPKERQTMLFSATMSDEVRALTTNYMKTPKEIELISDTITAKEIRQYAYEVPEKEKSNLLEKVTVSLNPSKCMIFANTQTKVDELMTEFRRKGYPCECLHGGMTQKERMLIMKAFKQQQFRYLFASDVAARGIDIDDVELVINYDSCRGLPNYVHRIGRCGRIGKRGMAVSFFLPNERAMLKDLIAYTEADIIKEDADKLVITEEQKEAFQKTIATKLAQKTAKNHELNAEIMKLHINAGKKDKLRTCEIVATICGIEGVTADDIGIIQILPTDSYVEILNDKGKLVLSQIRKRTMKGKVRKVNLARNK